MRSRSESGLERKRHSCMHTHSHTHIHMHVHEQSVSRELVRHSLPKVPNLCDTDYLSGNELPIDANAFAFVVSEHELNGCESKL